VSRTGKREGEDARRCHANGAFFQLRTRRTATSFLTSDEVRPDELSRAHTPAPTATVEGEGRCRTPIVCWQS